MKQKLAEDFERALKNNNNVEKIVRRIFSAGLIDAQFDFKKLKNTTVLMAFVMRNDYAMTERLLKEFKANRLLKKDGRYNALFLATELLLTNNQYNPEILTLLLEQDAKEQITFQEPRSGHTVVSLCVMHNKPKQTALFLQHTTDPLFLPIVAGDYPIHLACSNIPISEDTQAMLTVLLQHQPERQVLLAGREQELPIHTLLFRNDTKSLPLLLAHAPNEQLTAHRKDGTNVLHIAAVNLQFATLGYLKKHEVIPALVNEVCDGYSSLFLAITEDEDQTVTKSQAVIARFVDILLENGADVMIGSNGLIPLEKCCTEDYADVAKLLLAQKTIEQLSNVDVGGFTPLMSACYFGALNTVKLLLSYPICQTKEYLLLKSNTQFTALSLVKHRASLGTHDQELCDEIVSVLLQYYPNEQLALTEKDGPLDATELQEAFTAQLKL